MGIIQSRHSLTLRQWFYRNARLPIFISILAIVGVEILLLGVIGKHQHQLQEGVANRLAELSRLALSQGSTPLLQAGFDIATRELRASRAFVCEQGWVLVLKNPERSPCFIEPRFGYRVVRVPLRSGQFEFILQVPIFPQESLIYYTFGISVLVCVSGLILLRRLGYRLENDLFIPLFKNLSGQFYLPIKELEALRQKLSQLNYLRTKEAVASAVMARNVQVAHDIKSPLTALLFASKDFDLLPSTSRQVIRSAVSRISAIADSLIESKGKKESITQQSLSELIHEMILEKKTEYQNLTQLVLIEQLTGINKDIPTPMETDSLKRVLSNLINNAIESLEKHHGTVQMGAIKTNSNLQIWVEDTGIGFPSEFVSKVGQPGLTFGKKNGKGLGLSHAYEAI
ncbi:MAG: sensor histidine kinase, partial [Pseudomonadota bacterium]